MKAAQTGTRASSQRREIHNRTDIEAHPSKRRRANLRKPRTASARKSKRTRSSLAAHSPSGTPAWTTRSKKVAIAGTCAAFALSLVNAALAVVNSSAWLALMAGAYAILGTMRVPAIKCLSGSSSQKNRPVRPICGIGILTLLPIVVAIAFLLATGLPDTGRDEILMIATAAYVFGELSFAIANAVRARRRKVEALVALRDCSCVAAVVSMFSLQHSMVATFGEAGGSFAFTLDVCCGVATVLVILLLGLFAIRPTSTARHIPSRSSTLPSRQKKSLNKKQ